MTSKESTVIFILLTCFLCLSLKVKSQPGCIKVKLESDFPNYTARLGQDNYFQRLWSDASFTTLRITHPSLERPVLQLIHKPFLEINADTIPPQLINGVWVSQRLVTMGDSVFIRTVNPGRATISYPQSFYCSPYSKVFTVISDEGVRSDVNFGFTNESLQGKLRTNDSLSFPWQYHTQATLVAAPAQAQAILTLQGNGQYQFTAVTKGKYVYDVGVLRSTDSVQLYSNRLYITLVDSFDTQPRFAANPDHLVVDSSGTAALACLLNDRSFGLPDTPADVASAALMVPPKKGSAHFVSGVLHYQRDTDVFGTDTLFYSVCALGNSLLCDTAMVVIALSPPIADGSCVANDDFLSGATHTILQGNVLANDVFLPSASASVNAYTITNTAGTFALAANGSFIFNPLSNFSGPTHFVYQVCTTIGTEQFCDSATLYLVIFPSFSVSIKAYLEGALLNTIAVSSLGKPLMRDDLRHSPFTQLSYLPSRDPYQFPVVAANGLVYDLTTTQGGTSSPAVRFAEKGAGLLPGFDSISSPAVFLTTGDNAIVDWVFVELRDKDNATLVVSTRSALLQRDGDIVDLDGVSPLVFPNTPYHPYFVAVKHRSHLGVMTAAPIDFQNLSSGIDFTLANTPVFDFGDTGSYNYAGLAQNAFIIPGYACLYAGDFDANGLLKFSNPGDDVNILNTDVITYPANALFVSNFNAAYGYLPGDYNMDSKAKLDNPNDDKTLLLSQIFLYPLNSSLVFNFGAMVEQIPK